jgi:two-component system, cell cycle response regulator DivK
MTEGARSTELMGSPHPAVVLLVEANSDAREMYTEFLSQQGFVPIPMASAADALDVAPQADIIVTGMVFPGEMDGAQLVAQLKADERTRMIPVVVLTAYASTTHRQLAENAGCDAFLTKPLLPDELARELGRILALAELRHVRGSPTKAGLREDEQTGRSGHGSGGR